MLEYILNHILTIKHLGILLLENIHTYGLPRFRGGIAGHDIQRIIYRIIKRMDSFNISRANPWDRSQNHIFGVRFKTVI